MALSITARTSIGPLTTTFSAPTSCFTPYVTGGDGAYYAFPAETCSGSSSNTLQDPACFPTQMATFVFVDLPDLGTMGYLSPAPSCPAGFTKACTISRTSGGQAPTVTGSATANSAMYALMSAGETVFGCCMTGYGCDQTNPNYCTSSASAGQVITGSTFDEMCSPAPTSITVQGSQSTPVGTHMRIHLLTASSKTTLSTSSTLTTSNITPLTAGVSASPSPAPVAAESFPHGLSTRAKAAIGVVVPLGVLLLGVLIFYFFSGRNSKAASPSTSPSSLPSLGDKPELDGASAHPAVVYPEIDSTVLDETMSSEAGALVELQAPGVQAAELAGQVTIAELPGSEAAVELPKKTG